MRWVASTITGVPCSHASTSEMATGSRQVGLEAAGNKAAELAGAGTVERRREDSGAAASPTAAAAVAVEAATAFGVLGGGAPQPQWLVTLDTPRGYCRDFNTAVESGLVGGPQRSLDSFLSCAFLVSFPSAHKSKDFDAMNFNEKQR